MCRLLAYVSPAPRSLQDAVQEPTLSSFRALARIHRDGWGMAWAQPGTAGGVEVRRSTISAAEDPSFVTAATEIEALAGFLHLRWASEGFAIAPANTHPFLADGWAFAHNGFVRGAEHIEGDAGRPAPAARWPEPPTASATSASSCSAPSGPATC